MSFRSTYYTFTVPLYIPGYNLCSQLKPCTHLCLADTNRRFQCACPDNMKTLRQLSGNVTCLCEGPDCKQGKCNILKTTTEMPLIITPFLRIYLTSFYLFIHLILKRAFLRNIGNFAIKLVSILEQAFIIYSQNCLRLPYHQSLHNCLCLRLQRNNHRFLRHPFLSSIRCCPRPQCL